MKPILRPIAFGLLLALATGSSAFGQENSELATLRSQIRKLVAWTGKWKLSEQALPNPFGGTPGQASYATETRIVHGGVAMESRGKGKGPDGPLTWTETVYFDVASGSFRNLYVDSLGMISATPQLADSKRIIGTWDITAAGKKYQCRAQSTMAENGMSFSYEWNFSEDGVTWKPWLKGLARRVGKKSDSPAP